MRILKIGFLFLFLSVIGEAKTPKIKYAVIISANTEWKMVKKRYTSEEFFKSPWGEYFFGDIDNFNPEILLNLGTCGGFDGEVELMDIILADKTIIYDIREAMGDSKEAIADYTTDIDLNWL